MCIAVGYELCVFKRNRYVLYTEECGERMPPCGTQVVFPKLIDLVCNELDGVYRGTQSPGMQLCMILLPRSSTTFFKILRLIPNVKCSMSKVKYVYMRARGCICVYMRARGCIHACVCYLNLSYLMCVWLDISLGFLCVYYILDIFVVKYK